MIRKIAWVLLGAFIIIQFIHPKRNRAEGAQPHNIQTRFPVPDSTKQLLAVACMDCHSNNTKYPWYAKLQPVDWWMDGHVRNGKKHLNFDEYTNKSLRYQYHKMEETIEMVEDGEMPLKSYTWTHRGARLSQEEKRHLINWAKSVMNNMESKYPMDSLVRRN
jgi:hypothetical protein